MPSTTGLKENLPTSPSAGIGRISEPFAVSCAIAAGANAMAAATSSARNEPLEDRTMTPLPLAESNNPSPNGGSNAAAQAARLPAAGAKRP